MSISDPRAIKFCNESIRTEADLLAEIYYGAKKLLAVWQAQGIDKLIPGTVSVTDPTTGAVTTRPNTDLLEDGSPSDGRPPLTAAQVNGIINGLNSMITQSETPDAATGVKLIDVIVSTAVNIRQ